MKITAIRFPNILVFLLLVLFSTQHAFAECTPDQVIELGRQGWSPDEIKQMCGGSKARSEQFYAAL